MVVAMPVLGFLLVHSAVSNAAYLCVLVLARMNSGITALCNSSCVGGVCRCLVGIEVLM